MYSGAAGRECPRPDYWSCNQSDNQASSASGWSHRVRCFHPGSNFLPGSKRHPETGWSHYSLPAKRRSVACEQNFSDLVKPEKFVELKGLFDYPGMHYDGKSHGQYAAQVKRYTLTCKRPLSRDEQDRLKPILQTFKPATSWSWRSLTTTVHSFASAGVFTVQQLTREDVRHTRLSLLGDLLGAVLHKCRQRPESVVLMPWASPTCCGPWRSWWTMVRS